MHAFNISKPSIVITYNQPYKTLLELQKKCDFLQTVINIDVDTYTLDTGKPFEENQDPPCSTDPATIMYSSGTTGLSKGVMLMHKSYIFLMEIYRFSPFSELKLIIIDLEFTSINTDNHHVNARSQNRETD